MCAETAQQALSAHMNEAAAATEDDELDARHVGGNFARPLTS